LVLLIVAAPLTAAPAQAAEKGGAARWRLKLSGIGPLRLGVSERKARSLAPGLRVERRHFCDYWTVPGARRPASARSQARR
jgi:hypothetical protein